LALAWVRGSTRFFAGSGTCPLDPRYYDASAN
jgi:hypothetical protein